MRNQTNFEWLGERISQNGECMSKGINMTPDKPDSKAPESERQLYQDEVKAAQATCLACPVKPECYVYGLHLGAAGIMAYGLDRDTKRSLTALYGNGGLGRAVEFIKNAA